MSLLSQTRKKKVVGLIALFLMIVSAALSPIGGMVIHATNLVEHQLRNIEDLSSEKFHKLHINQNNDEILEINNKIDKLQFCNINSNIYREKLNNIFLDKKNKYKYLFSYSDYIRHSRVSIDLSGAIVTKFNADIRLPFLPDG